MAQRWWNAEKGDVHNRVFQYVRGVERAQFALYDWFSRLEAAYDTHPRANSLVDQNQLGRVSENVIASNVDTVSANVATVDVRARFETTDGDWASQRRAKKLEWYCDGLAALFDVGDLCRRGFKSGAALKGTAVNFGHIDEFGEIRLESIMPDDVVVDELESHNGLPKQMHLRTFVDRDDLRAQYPKFEAQIDRAQTGDAALWRKWSGYRPIAPGEIVVIRSWRLPIGPKGHKNYVPGRECITIDGCDLLDRKYHADHYPIPKMVWSKAPRGWFGIGLAERIVGIQYALNRRNWQIEQTLNKSASPTTYVNIADANMIAKTVDKIGNLAVYKAGVPVTPNPPLVSGETYQSRIDLKAAAFAETGVSQMAAQSVKPVGIDSAVGLREFRDQGTQRFAIQAKAYEQFWLDTILLLLELCKELGDDAPVIDHKAKFGSKKIKWSDVDMGDLKVQISAASTLSQTPAGRAQTVTEWSQAGLISTDEARRLLGHSDIERSMSLWNAAIEDVEHSLEMIEEGEVVTVEPYMNLQMIVTRGQSEYLRIMNLGAPEEILESLRDFITTAAFLIDQKKQAQQAQQTMASGATTPMSAVAAGTYAPSAA